jgi:hypothetical protein
LTWEGFFFNTGDKSGRVLIDSSQDLRMQTKIGDLWQDQLIIGKLSHGEKSYYGFRLLDT